MYIEEERYISNYSYGQTYTHTHTLTYISNSRAVDFTELPDYWIAGLEKDVTSKVFMPAWPS